MEIQNSLFPDLPVLDGTAVVEFAVNDSLITIELNGNDAPITAGNFIDLIERGVYDNVPFHRVIAEPSPFVAQGGDPQGSDPNFPIANLGRGGFIDPATGERRNIPLEIKLEGNSELTYNTQLGRLAGNSPPDVVLEHEKGAIAMARATAPDTASSQFYFALDELEFLDGDYAVFGEVTSGLDVVDAIQQGDRIEDAKVILGGENFKGGVRNLQSTNPDPVLDISDFNSDGNSDLVWRNAEDGRTVTWFMEVSKKIDRASIDVPNANWELQAIGDFDKDDNSDFVWRNRVSGLNTIWYLDGTEKRERQSLISVPDTDFNIEGAGDFDRDGNEDLIWRNSKDGTTSIWLMSGANRRDRISLTGVPDTDWDLAGVDDFNRDGYADLVWRNNKNGSNSIWYLKDGEQINRASIDSIADLNWQLQGVSDFNNDNNPDLMWRNFATGDNRIWLMDEANRTDSLIVDPILDANFEAIV